MSSSRASATPTADPIRCHDCGRKALAFKTGDLLVEGGFLVRALRYLECDSCGSQFFDHAAMGEIEAQRAAHTAKFPSTSKIDACRSDVASSGPARGMRPASAKLS